MDTNEELRDATDALAREVHDLSGRLSAKELLHHRTQRLTRISLAIGAIVGAVALVAVLALVRVNDVVGCIKEWSAASSQRSDILNEAAENVAAKKGLADKALRVLVDYRGEENNAETDRAKADYGNADDARLAAEYRLQFLREQYPPPQIEDYCPGMKDSSTVPKAQGE